MHACAQVPRLFFLGSTIATTIITMPKVKLAEEWSRPIKNEDESIKNHNNKQYRNQKHTHCDSDRKRNGVKIAQNENFQVQTPLN